MPSPVLWSQWPDLEVPAGVVVLETDGAAPGPDQLSEITFYVPKYMGGLAALELIPRMSNLEVVQLLTAGYEDALRFVEPAVTLCNARTVHDESTAELAVGLAIASRRGLPDFIRDGTHGIWNHRRRATLTDSRVAVVGNGSIGRTIERMLRAFAVSVQMYSFSGSPGSSPVTALSGDIGQYDIVVLALPLTEASRRMFDEELLSKMSAGSLLVNVARGQIVDTDALLREVQSGRLYAALDVCDPEPLPSSHPLWSEPNCLITPHVGGDTMAFEPRGRTLVAEQLERLVAGTPMNNVVQSGQA